MRKLEPKGAKGLMVGRQKDRDWDQDTTPNLVLFCVSPIPQYCLDFPPPLHPPHCLHQSVEQEAIICGRQPGKTAPWNGVSPLWAPACATETASVGLHLC